jgi:heme o synthase
MPGGSAMPHLMHRSDRGTKASYAASGVTGERLRDRAAGPAVARLAGLASLATLATLVLGVAVAARPNGVPFVEWPLVHGRLAPALEGVTTPMFAHRVAAGVAALLVLRLAVRVRTLAEAPRATVLLTTSAGVLFVVQVGIGGAVVVTGAGAVRTAHAVVAAAIALVMAGIAVSIGRLPSVRRGRAAVGTVITWRQRVGAYFALTKPKIIELLLITTVPAMLLARRGIPSPLLMGATLLGGAAAAGSANAINCYLDRDIDEVMRRTRRRPLPAQQVEPERALSFGFWLGAVAFFFLSITVNVLAASLSLAAIAFYVFVYTLWLKRTTSQNIVIGGAAGAVPALVGWAAVTGSVGLPAWVLFAIVFVWTPPHFWALAMQYRSDYQAAGVPMLPVVRGEQETRRQILGYALVLFAVSLALIPLAHMGPLYTTAAVVLGGMFVHKALRLWRERSAALAVALFRFSIVYLGLLFAAVAADAVLSRPV